MHIKNEHKTLLILDLDETLIFATKKRLERNADFFAFDYMVYIRPHVYEFLEAIKQDFLVAVWSSASDDYVDEVVKALFPKDYPLEFVWGRSRASYKQNRRLNRNGYYNSSLTSHYHYIKRLSKLKRKDYSLDRMLIVDDSPYKCQENYGNAIFPKEYQGEVEDDELLLLAKYLDTLKDKTNVRRIEKRNWRNVVEIE